MNEPIHVNDERFEQAVLKSELPVLVDFWAPWCAPCRLVAPLLDQIAREYEGKLVVAKVNTDENARSAAQFSIRGIPTLLFISGGEVLNQQVGALSYHALKLAVDQFLAEAKPQERAAS